MQDSKLSERKILRSIALHLGNDLGNVVVPAVVSFVGIAYALKPFKEDLGLLLFWILWIVAGLVSTTFFMHVYCVYNGKRVLKSIEKDYGTRTREHVFESFVKAAATGKIDLNIPDAARSFGEGRT